MTLPALVIGAGPAGLMAAEVLARGGVPVLVVEAKPSIGRKFLMAGKSGLNLTKDAPAEAFAQKISAEWLRPIVRAFGPLAVQDWARALGQEVFTGSSGRVFPVGMKASPLLRAWAGRLAATGATLRTGWRWQGFAGADFRFDTAAGPQLLRPQVTVLALGGASWARLGSDAAWVPWLNEKSVSILPFRAANVGVRVDWSAPMTRHFGAPLKAVGLHAGGVTQRGECVISARGLEGAGIYALAPALRGGAALTIDLAPDRSLPALTARLAGARAGESLTNRLRKAGLDALKVALLQEWARPLPADPAALAALVKGLPAHHLGPRPLDEAISVAGGIARESLTRDLELTTLPSVFAAGEMLDWEAPTGGYLLTTCLATGRHAGHAALRRLTG